MKVLYALLFIIGSLLACTGDCLTCHPALVPTINEDLRHKPMLTCINCHSANPSSMAECGSDCFGCHSMEKINKPNIREHDVIQECRDCHMKMKQELLDLVPSSDQSTAQPPLKDFLFEGN
ncbi:MAG: hypothetical protein DSZ03_04785 [Sulfurimonas sp.]|nr:MAG: hypothetical protein DSZ03_04785 [Sulfurimonas sp.]